MNLRNLQTQYLESEFYGRADKTISNNAFYLNEFITFMGRRKINPYTYSEWIKHAFERWSPTTAKVLAMSASNRFLTWLERIGKIERNPHSVTRLPLVKQSDPRPPITQEEFNALIVAAECDPPLQWAIQCGWETGMAIGDVSLLRWSNVMLDRNVIMIRRKKTQEQCVIPLPVSGQCISILESKMQRKEVRYPNSTATGIFYVDTDLAILYRRSDGSIQTRFAAIRDKSGVSPTKSFHNLRAAYCSRIANTGMNLALCCKMTGHKNPTIFEHYVSPELEKLRNVSEQAWA